MSSRVFKQQGADPVPVAAHTFPDIHRFLSPPPAEEPPTEEDAAAFALEDPVVQEPVAPQPVILMGVSEEEVALRENNAYQRGFQEAEKRGKQLLVRQEESAARALERSVQELQLFQRRLMEECERQVAALAMAVAKKITHHEVRMDSHLLLAMIRVALEHVADARRVRVKVHPADLAALQKTSSPGPGSDSLGIPLEWVADAGMERGGFLVESDMGIVDGRLSQQFQEIEKSFFGEKAG